MTDDANVHHLPAHRRGTGFEHMTNDEFMIAAFGPEALAICKTVSPEAQKRIWLKPIDPTRANEIMREFERRGSKPAFKV
jgi:hypothetical protein